MEKKVDLGTRIGSMILDHTIMSGICVVVCLPVFIVDIVNTMKPSYTHQIFIFTGSAIYAMAIGFNIYFFKDSFNGRSIAKRITKLQVVNSKSGLAASPLRCLVRNLFIIFWPIEFIVTLISPARRIGDFVAGTKIINYSADSPKIATKYTQLILSFILSLLLLFALMQPINKFLSGMNAKETLYVPTSYNVEESQQIMKLINDSLGQTFTSDIRVYDSVRNSNRKYISAVLQTNFRFQIRSLEFDVLDKKVQNLILRRFASEGVTGQIKYYYPNGMMTERIGGK